MGDGVGVDVGAGVGDGVGVDVGAGVGDGVGVDVGAGVGDGASVGARVGEDGDKGGLPWQAAITRITKVTAIIGLAVL